MSRDIRAETYRRDLALDRAGLNADTRTVPASLSSEIEVKRWFGREVLSHEPGAVDLGRAADGLPLLWNHDSDKPIGIVEGVRLEGGKLRGTLRFSRNSRAEEIWQDVQDGMLRNMSIGYQVQEWTETQGSDLVRVTRWTLTEASIAPVPADPSVGINRSINTSSQEESIVSEKTEQAPGSNPTPAPIIDLDSVRREAGQQAAKAERVRIADIEQAFGLGFVPKTQEFADLKSRAISEGWNIDQARKEVMEAVGRQITPAVNHSGLTDDKLGISHGRAIAAGEDSLDKFRAGVGEALMVRSGVSSDRQAIQKAREGGFLGVSLIRLGEQYLADHCGVQTRGLSNDKIAEMAMRSRAHGMTTSDFANVLANTANKALLKGWESAPETWETWTRRGSVPDFKQATRTGISGFTSLSVVPEDGEITYGKFTDRKETVQAVSYAKKFRITYQAIKNDDLNAFTAVPMAMGRAGKRVIGDVVYVLLDGTGPTLNQDSIALWDTSTHKNYVAAATAPTVSTLDTAVTAMAKQTDPNHGKVLNIRPRYLLVPVALESTARVLMASQYDPGASPGSTTGKNIQTPNPYQGRYEVVADARLDGQTNGTAAWYLLGDPDIYDTVEVAFVDGIAEPYLREQAEWDTRGVEWVVGVDFGVAALDFRAMHKYKGNT